MVDAKDPRPASRLRLSEAEARLLAECAGVTWPADFLRELTATPDSNGDEKPPAEHGGARDGEVAARADSPLASLLDRGVLQHDGAKVVVHPSVQINLELLFNSLAYVLVRGQRGEYAVRALYAVNEPLGASLFLLEDWGLELSLFDTRGLVQELSRCVPPGAPEGDEGSQPDRSSPLTGRVPLAALMGSALASEMGRALPGTMTASETDLMSRIAGEAEGHLTFLVNGPGRDRTLHVAPQLWISSAAGWSAVRRVVPTDAERAGGYDVVVELEPVEPHDVVDGIAYDLAGLIQANSPGVAS